MAARDRPHHLSDFHVTSGSATPVPPCRHASEDAATTRRAACIGTTRRRRRAAREEVRVRDAANPSREASAMRSGKAAARGSNTKMSGWGIRSCAGKTTIATAKQSET